MWTRAELKENAKKFFKYNYWQMVLVSLILTMVGGGGGGVSFNYTVNNPQNSEDLFGFGRMSDSQAMTLLIGVMVVVLVIWILAAALSAFLFNPLQVGAQRFFVVSHYRKAGLGELGFAFSSSYLNVVKIMFLRSMYVFLWSLLFIIPGIIKTYEYLMIPYILAENPDIDSKEAFAMSKQMMDGNKWKTFVLGLSFYGWILLSVLTCGILTIFYVNPYIHMTMAELYVALKEITYGGRGQGMYQQNSNQWNGNGQWDGSNGQWDNGQPNNNQWDNSNQWNNSNQWDNSNSQWNNNNQWDNSNSQWDNSNSQWDNSNSQWNNNNQWDNSNSQWNNNNQWDNNNGQWNNTQQNSNQWDNNSTTQDK